MLSVDSNRHYLLEIINPLKDNVLQSVLTPHWPNPPTDQPYFNTSNMWCCVVCRMLLQCM